MLAPSLQFGVPGGMELAILLLLGVLAAPFVLVWWLVSRARGEDSERGSDPE